MINPSSDTSEKPAPAPDAIDGVWRIDGPLAIQTVSDWHRRMLEQLASASKVVIDLGGINAIDVFGIQLLVALRRLATKQGINLIFISVPPLVEDACIAAGMSRSMFLSHECLAQDELRPEQQPDGSASSSCGKPTAVDIP